MLLALRTATRVAVLPSAVPLLRRWLQIAISSSGGPLHRLDILDTEMEITFSGSTVSLPGVAFGGSHAGEHGPW